MSKNKKGTKECPKCNTIHSKPGTYCSRKCANSRTYTDEDRKKMSIALRTSKKYKESVKNRVFKGMFSEETKKRLSDQQKEICTERRYKFERTVPFEKWSKHMKRNHLIRIKNNQCEECGFSKLDEKGVGPFDMHHIDGDNTNDKIENLQLLCKNCHWFTDNWGNKKREL